MARFNHSKVNMQKRISYESRLYDYPPPAFNSSGYNKAQRPPHRPYWFKLSFGKHKGMTLPEVFFHDPKYVVDYLYSDNGLFRNLEKEFPSKYERIMCHQLEVLANRVNRIIPPDGKRIAIIVDRHGVFERVEFVRIGCKLTKQLRRGSKIVKKVRFLNMAAPLHYEQPEKGFRQLGASLRRLFFGHPDYEPSASEACKVLSDEERFDLSKVKSHKSLKYSDRDHRKLLAKYKSQRQH